MFDIQLNESGTRHLQITAENLSTIKKYSLFDGLVGSTGIVDETVLDKLKMTIRALIALYNKQKDSLAPAEAAEAAEA